LAALKALQAHLPSLPPSMGCDGGGQCIDAHPATWTSDEKTAF